MKKLLFVLPVMGLTSVAEAQFGVTGGLNIAKYSYVSDRGPLFSFNAGLLYRTSLAHAIVWQPALQFTGKGAVVYPPIPVGSSNPNEKYLNYLDFVQLSAPWLLGSAVGDAFRFEIGAGPYAAVLTGAHQTQVGYDGTRAKVSFRIGAKDTADFKRFDAGIHFATGFVMGHRLGFHVQYNLGLANMNARSSQPALTMRNTGLNFSYYFGKRR